MRKDILIATNLSLITGLGLSACKAIGARDFNPDSASKTPNSTEIDPTLVPFPKIEPLNEKDIKVFLDNCQNCDELGITTETVAGGYFNGDFLFHSKDKNDADYFYLNQGTSFEPLNWESTDSEFALVPKANEGDIYTGLKYFIWNPNVTDDSGNMIVTYQPDGTANSAQKFILPSNNDIEPRLKRARFIVPEISPESLLPQEVKEKFELAGVDLAQMQNAKYDKDGLHITLPDGEVIVLTNTDLQKGIYNGQDNVLQYRDETNQNVIYAYDKESGKWEVEVTPEGQLDLDLKRWGITPEKYNVGYDKEGKIELREKDTNKLIYWDGKWSNDVMVDMVVATNNCQPTKFPQAPGINSPPREMKEEWQKHTNPIMQEISFAPIVKSMGNVRAMFIYLPGTDNCWGTIVEQLSVPRADFFWMDQGGELQSLEYFDAKLHK